MGINLVIACHRHRVYGYSMRREEPWDVQWWFRGEHADCWEHGDIRAYRDCDDWPGHYEEAWPYETRPAVVAKAAYR